MRRRQAKVRKAPDPTRGTPFPVTTTGVHYEDLETGAIGKVVPCPCDDPLILEFEDGRRDAFFVRNLQPTAADVTLPPFRSRETKPHGPRAETIDKLIKIHKFLKAQSAPVQRGKIQSALGFDVTFHLLRIPCKQNRWNLEILGIAERVRIHRGRGGTAWQLTEVGRTQGETMIQALRKE